MTREPLSPHDLERLSAYLDDALPAADRAALEADLAADPRLQHELDELRLVVTGVRNLPPLRAPRDFTLTHEMLAAHESARMVRFPVGRALWLAQTAAAILLAAFGVWFLRPVALVETAPAAVMMDAPVAPVAPTAPPMMQQAPSGGAALDDTLSDEAMPEAALGMAAGDVDMEVAEEAVPIAEAEVGAFDMGANALDTDGIAPPPAASRVMPAPTVARVEPAPTEVAREPMAMPDDKAAESPPLEARNWQRPLGAVLLGLALMLVVGAVYTFNQQRR